MNYLTTWMLAASAVCAAALIAITRDPLFGLVLLVCLIGAVWALP